MLVILFILPTFSTPLFQHSCVSYKFWLVVTRVPKVPSLKPRLSNILLKNIGEIHVYAAVYVKKKKNFAVCFTLRLNLMYTDNEHDTHILVHVFFSGASRCKGPWPPVLRTQTHLDYGKRFIRFIKFRESLSTAVFHLYLDLIFGCFFTFWCALILPSWDIANPCYAPLFS